MATVFYERDAKPDALKGKTIAIMGYGSQGHAQAQNLRDSGYNVIVGLDPHRQSANTATADGMTVLAPPKPPSVQTGFRFSPPTKPWRTFSTPPSNRRFSTGKILGFSHGFRIHFKTIVPPADVDVSMVAPKGPGHLVRSVYTQGGGVPALLAIHQDASGKRRNSASPTPTESARPAPEF